MEKSNQVQQDSNLSIYERVRCVLNEAKKEIEAGRLKGKHGINLYVKKDGKWSRPIFGNGGNRLISNEKKCENGQTVYIPYLDDDAYKKAYTDAISVAAKALGVGADVYFEKDKGKYASTVRDEGPVQPSVPVKPVLSSKGRDWKAAVAFTASQTDSAEVISEKIRSKYTITDEDLEKLLKQSGKKS